MLFFLLLVLVAVATSDDKSHSIDTLDPDLQKAVNGINNCNLTDDEKIITGFIILKTNMQFCCECTEGARIYAPEDILNENYEGYILSYHGWNVYDIKDRLTGQMNGDLRNNITNLSVGCALKRQHPILEYVSSWLRITDDIACIIKKYNYVGSFRYPIRFKFQDFKYLPFAFN